MTDEDTRLIYPPSSRAFKARCLRMPDDAVPWSAHGFDQAVATGTEVEVLREQVRVNVNGLRVSALLFMASAASVNQIWHFYRDDVRLPRPLGDWRTGAQTIPVIYPCFAIYYPGELLRLNIENQSGAVKDYAATLIGWYF